MKCSDCQRNLAEYVAKTLDDAASAQVLRHLADGCSDCAETLDQIEEAWSLVAEEATPVVPPPHLKQRLMARIEASQRAASVPPPLADAAPEELFSRRLSVSKAAAMWALAAAFVGVAAGFFWQLASVNNDLDRADLLARYQHEIEKEREQFGGLDFQLASFQSNDGMEPIQGHVLWDRSARQLHLYVFQLPETSAPANYRVWFVTTDQRWLPGAWLETLDSHFWKALCELPEPKEATVAQLVILQHDDRDDAARQPGAKPPGEPVAQVASPSLPAP